jgi:hypothetical protein
MRGPLQYIWALPNTAIGLLLVPIVMLTRGHFQVVDGVLELWGGCLSSGLRHLPLAGGASAITFGHIVLARDRRSLTFTRRHERVHVRQSEVWGPAFIPAYLLAGLWGLLTGAGAYEGNYFEREAMRRADG